MTPPLRRPRADRGAVAVEFALVLPVLLMLVFGLIQFGLVFSQSSALASAARSGARIGSVNLVTATTCGQVYAQTLDQAKQGLGTDSAKVTVTVKRGAAEGTAIPVCSSPTSSVASCKNAAVSTPETLYVVVEYLANVSIPLLPPLEIPLKTTGAYRCEYS